VGHGGPLAGAQELWNAPWIDLAPQAGLLVLVPSHLDHAVLPNEDPDDTRYSISLDLVLSAPVVGEGETPPEYLAPHPSQWHQV